MKDLAAAVARAAAPSPAITRQLYLVAIAANKFLAGAHDDAVGDQQMDELLDGLCEATHELDRLLAFEPSPQRPRLQ